MRRIELASVPGQPDDLMIEAADDPVDSKSWRPCPQGVNCLYLIYHRDGNGLWEKSSEIRFQKGHVGVYDEGKAPGVRNGISNVALIAVLIDRLKNDPANQAALGKLKEVLGAMMSSPTVVSTPKSELAELQSQLAEMKAQFEQLTKAGK